MNLLGYEALQLNDNAKEIQRLLEESSTELDDILREVRINLDKAEYKNLSDNTE